MYIWKGNINAERCIQVLEQHKLPSRYLCVFLQHNAKPNIAAMTAVEDVEDEFELAGLQYRPFTS